MTKNSIPERTVQQLPDAILQAINDGHLEHLIEKVTISEDKSPTKKAEVREFDALYALTLEGMSVLCDGKLEPQTAIADLPKGEKDEAKIKALRQLGACDHFNYGRLLGVRAKVRADLESDIAGPEKTIDKMVKATMAMFPSEAAARDFVIAQLKSVGKIPADYGSGPAAEEAIEEVSEAAEEVAATTSGKKSKR